FCHPLRRCPPSELVVLRSEVPGKWAAPVSRQPRPAYRPTQCPVFAALPLPASFQWWFYPPVEKRVQRCPASCLVSAVPIAILRGETSGCLRARAEPKCEPLNRE